MHNIFIHERANKHTHTCRLLYTPVFCFSSQPFININIPINKRLSNPRLDIIVVVISMRNPLFLLLECHSGVWHSPAFFFLASFFGGSGASATDYGTMMFCTVAALHRCHHRHVDFSFADINLSTIWMVYLSIWRAFSGWSRRQSKACVFMGLSDGMWSWRLIGESLQVEMP